MKHRASKSEHLSPSAAQGCDIDEISARLAALADRINASNSTWRRRVTIRTISKYLPFFGKLEERNDPKVRQKQVKLRVDDQSIDTVEGSWHAPDPDGRIWPKLTIGEQTNLRALEDKIAEQSAELATRCIQIADLSNIRQQQANDLLVASEDIECLKETVAELQRTLARRDTEAIATTQTLGRLEKENIAVQVQLSEALHEAAQFSHLLLNVKTAFNDKIVEVATAQETIEGLKIELAKTQSENKQIVAAVYAKISQRHREELEQQCKVFGEKIGQMWGIVAKRDRKIKNLEAARYEIGERLEALSKATGTFESIQQISREKIESQAKEIEFLETALKVEREGFTGKLMSLDAELERPLLVQDDMGRRSPGTGNNARPFPKLVA
jgi:DNA repair exonuclease SbcCD ATPase subunit